MPFQNSPVPSDSEQHVSSPNKTPVRCNSECFKPASASERALRFQILKNTSNAVHEDDINKLKELRVVIDNSYTDSESPRALYTDIENPLQNTNIVILACKLNKFNVLEYILSENSILNTYSCKIGGRIIVPESEDEQHHNALYYAIRSNNVHLLNTLIFKWPGCYFSNKSEELYILLSEAYLELKLKNVELTQEMEFCIESTLLNIRFYSLTPDSNMFVSTSGVEEQIKLIIENIQLIVTTCKEVDDVCLLIIKFIADNMHNLKNKLKTSNFSRLPWEEMEFLLVVFIHAKRSWTKSSLTYYPLLSKAKIFRYLEKFSTCLATEFCYRQNMNESVVTHNAERLCDSTASDIKQGSVFVDLRNDYCLLKTGYALETIQIYLETVVSADSSQENFEVLLTRCFQVIKRNIVEIHKVSCISYGILIQSLSTNTRDVVLCKCDPKLNICSLLKSNKDKENRESSSGIFNEFLKDMKKLNGVVSEVLNKIKIKVLAVFLEHLAHATCLDEVMKFVDAIDPTKVKEIVLSKAGMGKHEQLEKIIKVLNEMMIDQTMYEEQILLEIHQIIDQEKCKCTHPRTNYDIDLTLQKYWKFNHGKKMTEHDFINAKSIANQILMCFGPRMRCQSIKTIAELVVEIFTSIAPRMQMRVNEMYNIVLQILQIAEFQTEQMTWVCELWNKCNKTYLICESDTERRKNRDNCVHTKTFRKFNCNLQDVLQSTTQHIFINSNNRLSDIGMNTKLFDEFSSFRNNKNLQAIIETLVLEELSVSKNSNNYMLGNPWHLEESCPLLIGKGLYDFLSNGHVIEVQLFDPSIAIFVNAILLCSPAFPEEKKSTLTIQNDIQYLRASRDRNVLISTNQENMFVALMEGKLKTVKKCIKNGADINGRNFQMWTALHFAAKGPSVKCVKFLINQNIRKNCKDVNGQNPLHIAAMYGRKAIVEYLIKETNICRNELDNRGKTPLLCAIQNCFIDVINILLGVGTNLNMSSTPSLHHPRENYYDTQLCSGKKTKSHKLTEEVSLLHSAAENGCMELIEALLESNVNINTENFIQATPLHMAAENGHLQVVKNLISHGASVNKPDRYGCIPLHFAVEHGHEHVVRLLLEGGSNINMAERTLNCTPLSYAACKGYIQIAEILLEKGANVDSISLEGMSPLHFAVIKENKDLVDLLIRNGASVNAATKDGNTPLHFCAMKDDIEILEFLIQNGGNVNARNRKFQTILHIACENNCKYVSNVLIAENVEINAKDVMGFTSLHVSCVDGHVNTVHSILESGGNVNVGDKSKRTPLHMAALYGICSVIDLLVERGANIHRKDSKGFTALHWASLRGNINVVKNLIHKNADVNATDENGVSPLHLAVQGNHKEVIKILLQKGAHIEATVPISSSLFENSNFNWGEKMREEIKELIMIDVPAMRDIVLKRYEKILMYEKVYSPLYFAVYNNNTAVVTVLLSKGAKVCVRGNLCILAAVYFGYKRILGILLGSKGIDNISNHDSAILLYVAALKGNVQILKMILSKVANQVECESFVFSPIYIAARKGHSDALKFLILNNPNVYVINNFTRTTILHRAAALGYQIVVELLLQNKLVPPHFRDSEYTTALEHAAANGHKEIAEMLLQCKDVNINAKGNDDFTVLHIAAQMGKLEMVKFLVEKGADVSASNHKGSKPIHVAAREGRVSVVKYFLTIGVDINILGHVGQTCLHYAIAAGQAQMVNFLLQENTDVNVPDWNGLTSIHFAAAYCHKDFVKSLLENGAYFNVVDKVYEKNPFEMAANTDISFLLAFTGMLFDAVKSNNICALEVCIRNGGVVNAKNKDNVTPLIHAAWKGTKGVIDILLRNKANPNVTGKSGCSPLHYAAKFSHFDIVKALLANGAVYNIENIRQKTPLDFAVHTDIVNLLTLIDKLFMYAQSGVINLIIELKSIEDVDILKAVSNACNKEKESITACAIGNGYPFMEDLKKMLIDVTSPNNLFLA